MTPVRHALRGVPQHLHFTKWHLSSVSEETATIWPCCEPRRQLKHKQQLANDAERPWHQGGTPHGGEQAIQRQDGSGGCGAERKAEATSEQRKEMEFGAFYGVVAS